VFHLERRRGRGSIGGGEKLVSFKEIIKRTPGIFS
jgi:hypothetical protein